MEAAVVNAVPPGGKALVLNAGHFAARWVNLCKAFGLNYVSLDTEWGQPVDPDRVAEALATKPRHHLCVRDLERDFDRHGPPDRGDRPGRRQDARAPGDRRDFGRRGHGVPHRQVGNRPACASARRKR